MKYYLKLGILFLLLGGLFFCSTHFNVEASTNSLPRENTIEEAIAILQKNRSTFNELNPFTYTYKEQPRYGIPYQIGKVSNEFVNSGILNTINIYRALAGVSGQVTVDPQLAEEAQRHVMYNALHDISNISGKPVDNQIEDWWVHNPVNDWTIDSPDYISNSFISPKSIGCGSLAMCWIFNDARENILNPGNTKIGLGYALSATNTFAETTFHQISFDDYDYISWPSAGAFPTDGFNNSTDNLWSINLNNKKYQLISENDIKVKVTRNNDGKTWTLDSTNVASSRGIRSFSTSRNVIKFQPNIGFITDADQYNVEITGVKDNLGNNVAINYSVRFFDTPPDSMVKDYILDWKERSGKPLASPNKVTFQNDKELEKYVRDHLKIPNGDITEEDLAREYVLDIYDKVNDKNLLRKFKNVHTLGVFLDLHDYSFLKDMKYLRDIGYSDFKHYDQDKIINSDLMDEIEHTTLSYLTELGVDKVKLNSLEKLVAHVPNLTSLYLPSEDIKSIKPLEKLTNLESLQLFSKNMTDLDSLLQLKSLNTLTLDLQGNNYHPDQLKGVISQLSSLISLSLINLHLDDVSFLKTLIGLTTLNLTENDIKDISPLQSLDNIRLLELSKNQISDVSSIQGLKEMVKLVLSENQISDISPLIQMKKLTLISIEHNHLKDISILSRTNGLPLISLNLKENFLDLTDGSSPMNIISGYVNAQRSIEYQPQRQLKLESIQLNRPQEHALGLGTEQSELIETYAIYNDGTKKAISGSEVDLESTDSKVLQIKDGNMIGIKPGVAEVKAVYQGISSVVEVDVGFNADVLSQLGNKLVFMVDNPIAIIKGKVTKSPAAPVIKNGSTLIPLRFVSESLGYHVDWNNDLKKITITNDNKMITFVLTELFADVNGKSITMNEPAQLINGSSYVPLRVLFEALDKKLFYKDGFILVSDESFDGYQLVEMMK